MDVREASRAFTGWTFETKLPRLPYGRFPWKFEYRPEDHDEGEKTFLGHKGNFNGEDIINIIVQQPACADFICLCHCGAIVYEAEVEPGTVGVCHCLDCQRLTGSPFRANIRAEAAGFCILKGQPRHYVKTGDSGAKRIHLFCEVCASPIYSCAIENPQSYTLLFDTAAV